MPIITRYNVLHPGFSPVDCQQILDTGVSTGSGVYSIYNPVDPVNKKDVYCDMETDGGGWLVRNVLTTNSLLKEHTIMILYSSVSSKLFRSLEKFQLPITRSKIDQNKNYKI